MIRTITRTTIGGYLRIARLPLDTVLRITRRGQTSGSRLLVDRLDATVRGVLGAMTGDHELQADASRRGDAARERTRAMRLHAEAERVSERADERLDERTTKAEQRRERAEAEAARRSKRADREREARKQRLDEARKRRRTKSAEAAAQTRRAVEGRAKRARLAQLESESGAIESEERAIEADDQARVLAEVAGAAKAQRKAD